MKTEEKEMRIAVCDDENVWINHMVEYIEQIKSTYRGIEYDVFSSGEEFLGRYNKEIPYDIVILDIEMKSISGIEVANAIRDKDNSVIIFFLTSHREYVYECFKPMPMNFWVKPVEYEVFKEDIKRAYHRIEESTSHIKIIENRQKIRLKCSDIIYIENKERKSWIHTASGIYKVNKLLTELMRELDDKVFVRVYKSFIVNLRHVYIINENQITLYNCNEKIPISRTYKPELLDKYINLKERESF